jgi:hypothetical protein
VAADVHGVLDLKNTINAMVDQLNRFVSEVTRVAREVGTEGKLVKRGGHPLRGPPPKVKLQLMIGSPARGRVRLPRKDGRWRTTIRIGFEPRNRALTRPRKNPRAN